MAASSAIVVYKEHVPYAKYVQRFVQLCITAYVFFLLTEWQKMEQDAQES